MCFHEKKSLNYGYLPFKKFMVLFGRGYEPHLTHTHPATFKSKHSRSNKAFLSNLSGLAWSEKGNSREKTDVLVILKGDYK